MKATATGLKRILNAFVYSYDGFCAVWKSEAAFRQDLLFCFVAGVFLCFFPVSACERSVMALTLMLIPLAELVNSAIETVIDRISPEYHLLSKKAKDIGSLLVLVSFITLAIVWGIILIPFV